MTVVEKAAYLKGLADGLKLNRDNPTDQVLLEVLDLVSDLSKEQAVLSDHVKDLLQLTDELDDDLATLESDFYDEDADEDYDSDYEDDEDEDIAYYEATCPNCGETVCFDDSIDPEHVVCPNCKEEFALEAAEEDE